MSNLNLSEKSLENQVINQEKGNSIFYDNSTTTKVELILNRTLASIKGDNINEVDLSTTDKNYYLKLLNIVVNKNAEIFDDYKFIVNDGQTIFQRDLLMSISYLEDLIYYNLMKSGKYKNAKKLCKENIDEFLEMKLGFIEGLIDEDKVFKKAFKSQNFGYKLLTTKLEKTWLERFELTKKMLVK